MATAAPPPSQTWWDDAAANGGAAAAAAAGPPKPKPPVKGRRYQDVYERPTAAVGQAGRCLVQPDRIHDRLVHPGPLASSSPPGGGGGGGGGGGTARRLGGGAGGGGSGALAGGTGSSIGSNLSSRQAARQMIERFCEANNAVPTFSPRAVQWLSPRELRSKARAESGYEGPASARPSPRGPKFTHEVMIEVPGMRPFSRKRFRKVLRGPGADRLPREFKHVAPIKVPLPKKEKSKPRLDRYGLGDIVALTAPLGSLHYGKKTHSAHPFFIGAHPVLPPPPAHQVDQMLSSPPAAAQPAIAPRLRPTCGNAPLV